MDIDDLKARLERVEGVLTRVADGDFDQRLELGNTPDDLTSLEMGINFMILDLRAMIEANKQSEAKLRQQAEELQAKLARIEEQEVAIRELSTPVVEIWDDVLALPIVGVLDSKRSMELMDSLLESISRTQSRNVVLDLTGVEVVDTRTADHLMKVVQAAELLGARCVLTGLSPAVAQTLAEIGAELGGAVTKRNLKEGLRYCLGGREG